MAKVPEYKPRVITTAWLRIVEIGHTGKTCIFDVNSKEGGTNLGQIKWFSYWRKYSFYPNANTVYEHQCLRDVALTLEVLMDKRKKET